MKMDLSIIIPVYNCSQYLKSGFEKLRHLYSTDVVFEIIYVNDGSSDNSLNILKEIEGNNPFVKVISQENQGSSGARNTAIEVAQGKYIQFLDADDTIDFEKVIPLLLKAISNNIDALSYRLDSVDDFGNKLSEMNANAVSFDKIITGIEALIQGYQPSSICVFLFKTDFLNINQLRITPKITHMDVEFTSRMMLVAKRVLFVDVIAYHYLFRLDSITKPKSIIGLKKFLHDEVVISKMILGTINTNMDKNLIVAIQKNYNSVVWNLLWSFIVKPKEVDFDFKIRCLQELKNDGLYPIKGKLKTNFQNFTRIFFNQIKAFKLLLRLIS